MVITMTEGSMTKIDGRRPIVELFDALCTEFGDEKGEKIINLIVSKCGGNRVSVPDFDDLYRIGRDRVIRRQYRKGNISVTALMIEHRLSRPQVLRILKDGDRPE